MGFVGSAVRTTGVKKMVRTADPTDYFSVGTVGYVR